MPIMENTLNIRNKKKIEWIDMARVITMLLVIIGHSNYTYIPTDFGSLNYPEPEETCISYLFLKKMVYFIYSFHMPVFMAISGLCFSLGFHKTKALRDLIINKGKRLLIPFLVVTTFVAIPIKFIGGYYSTSENIFHDIIMGQYLLMGNSHLWFLVSLFYCFIIFYLIEPIHKKFPLLFWCGFTGLALSTWIIQILLGYDAFGIPGMTKNLLYFAIGFYSKDWCDRYYPNIWITISSITASVVFFFWASTLNWYLKQFISPVFALWGCFNVLCVCKLIIRYTSATKALPYKFFRDKNFQLYLYGDPANYLIVPALFLIGGDYFDSNLFVISAFFIRIIGAVLLTIIILNIITFVKATANVLNLNKA